MFINTIIFIVLTLLTQSAWSKFDVPSSKPNCSVQHNGQKLSEGDNIDVHGKFYKVEDCELHRAYHACGTHVLFIINIVCQALEKHKINASKQRFSRFVKQKLLTEACCQSLCTISEMTRYCP
ncbi:unnamed protein product [Rotaria magnacalcarata]|uniref:Insulin-like domain-containing protein n=1 Tax=Rotaria magnacalcarata TaxID=392030 RepID=A0A818Y8K2_9BILA|nr:unnamed protein product [Rotaria magnacalcarata]CAF1655014.1 unnamed protein product [Rotaria magnacalcarata]CAF2064604.1 unnamed protein product [Rotaria magnacalcarata]CAF2148420.1 unnamed protein product [Rotaria magnacalcarata]CAF2268742.1 unnamed protein product [Rotaria magnacalcarata]